MCAAPGKGLFSSLKLRIMLVSLIAGIGTITVLWILQKPHHRAPSGEPILTAVILDDSTSMLDLAAIQREGRYVLEPKIEIAKAYLRPWMEAELSTHTPLVLSGLLPRTYTDRKITITPETTYWAGDKEFVTFDPVRVGQKVKIREYGHQAAGPIPEASLKLLDATALAEAFSHTELPHTITPLGDTLYEYALATQQKFFPNVASPPFRVLVLTDGIDFFGAASVCEKIQALSEQHILRTDQIALHIIHYLPTTFEKGATPQIPENLQRLQAQLSEKQQAYLKALHHCLEPYQEWVRVDVIDSARSLSDLLAGATFQPQEEPASPATPSSVLPEAYHYAREHQIPYVHREPLPSLEKLADFIGELTQEVRIIPFPYGHFEGYASHENIFFAGALDTSQRTIDWSFFRLHTARGDQAQFDLLSTLVTPANYWTQRDYIQFRDTRTPGILLRKFKNSFENILGIDLRSFSRREISVFSALNSSTPKKAIMSDSTTLLLYYDNRQLQDGEIIWAIKFPEGTFEVTLTSEGGEIERITIPNPHDPRIELLKLPPVPPRYRHGQVLGISYGFQGQDVFFVTRVITINNTTVQENLTYDLNSGQWNILPRGFNREPDRLIAPPFEITIPIKDEDHLARLFIENVEFLNPQPIDPAIVLKHQGSVRHETKGIIKIYQLPGSPSELLPLTFSYSPGMDAWTEKDLSEMGVKAYLFSSLEASERQSPLVFLIFSKSDQDYYGVVRRTFFQQQN